MSMRDGGLQKKKIIYRQNISKKIPYSVFVPELSWIYRKRSLFIVFFEKRG
jgi:hypothetical protein